MQGVLYGCSHVSPVRLLPLGKSIYGLLTGLLDSQTLHRPNPNPPRLTQIQLFYGLMISCETDGHYGCSTVVLRLFYGLMISCEIDGYESQAKQLIVTIRTTVVLMCITVVLTFNLQQYIGLSCSV